MTPRVPPVDLGLSRRGMLGVVTLAAAGSLSWVRGSAPSQAVVPGAQPSPSPSGSGSGSPSARPLPAGPVSRAPVLVATRPAYRVHDVLPGAPARAIALTLDDGPDPHWTPLVLEVLAQHRVVATFCMVGQEVRAHPEVARQVVAQGHRVCNHSDSHPQPFTHRTRAAIEREIGAAQKSILDATGQAPTVFRSPGGDWSPDVFAAAAAHGLAPLDWDVDPQDWRRGSRSSVIAGTLLTALPGQIILCHDGGGDRSATLAALRQVLPVLQRRGLEFVAL